MRNEINEIELVLLIGDMKPETIIELLQQNGYNIESVLEGKEELKKYLYFDTPDKTLYHSGESLRIRLAKEAGGRHKVTYKVPNVPRTEEGYANRKEYNAAFSEEPILENALEKFFVEYPEVGLPNNLQHVVNVDKTRSTYELTSRDGETAELAFEDVLAIDPNNNAIQKRLTREMEVELRSAPTEILDDIRTIIKSYDPSIISSKKSKYNLALEAIEEQQWTK